MKWQTEGIAKMTNLQEHLNMYIVSVQLVTAALMPLLEKGSLKKVANISTTLGSKGVSSPMVSMHTRSLRLHSTCLLNSMH